MKLSQLLSGRSKMRQIALILLFSAPAGATQPLADFLAGARSSSFDARSQAATVEQRGWEKDAALGRLLPSFTARGTYTHNQIEVALPASAIPGATEDVVITPQNQLDAVLTLDVPLVDVANYYRYGQARHLAKAAEAQGELTGTTLDQAVTRAYYNFIGASALVSAADRNVKIAEENLAYVTTRVGAGVATELDRERARANLELAKQGRVDADLGRILAARSLETLSGIQATPVTEYPVDDLRREGNLSEWLASHDTPNDRVQRHLSEAAASAKKAAAFSLLPTLSANAQERLTNATGFAGRADFYTLQAVLQWRLDYSTYATAQAQAAAADVQIVAAERTRRSTEDQVFEAYQRVESGIAKSASARAQAEAASKAEKLALERYKAGALTQLEVTQSQKEAFQANASRIQADADLAYARVWLRVIAGKPATVPPSSIPPERVDDLEAQKPLPEVAPSTAPAVPGAPGAAPTGAAPTTPGAPAPAARTGATTPAPATPAGAGAPSGATAPGAPGGANAPAPGR